jgi:chemotaxis protein CheC
MLTVEQNREALMQIVRGAFSRAAYSLSELTGCPALIEVREMATCEMHDLENELSGFAGSDLASVHQPFIGPVAGEAFLLFDRADAARLSGVLTREEPMTNQLSESDSEALMEVGNLLLDHCVSALGSLSGSQVIFSIPRLHLGSLHHLLDRLAMGKPGRALVIRVSFELRDHLLNGCAVMLHSDWPDLLAGTIERREEAEV